MSRTSLRKKFLLWVLQQLDFTFTEFRERAQVFHQFNRPSSLKKSVAKRKWNHEEKEWSRGKKIYDYISWLTMFQCFLFILVLYISPSSGEDQQEKSRRRRTNQRRGVCGTHTKSIDDGCDSNENWLDLNHHWNKILYIDIIGFICYSTNFSTIFF